MVMQPVAAIASAASRSSPSVEIASTIAHATSGSTRKIATCPGYAR